MRRYNYYSLVTVGFSGVVFGLKVSQAAAAGGSLQRSHASVEQSGQCRQQLGL